MHKLNQHFLVFIRKIKNVKSNTTFKPSLYFAESFLNVEGKIAPHGRENHNLTHKFKSFFNSFKKLDDDSRNRIYKIILLSKDIHLYFEDINADVTVLHKLNIEKIVGDDSLNNLMIALWDSLKTNSWEIDKHYEEFFENQDTKTCTFCGINQLPNPSSYRADYDHIAFKGDYPISSINLKNIAPSCSECNQKYKHSKDVFYSDDGRLNRRPFIYPFKNHLDIQIDFSTSILPTTDINNMDGKWIINFVPENDFTNTWNDVYEIKSRYINEVLDTDYKTWIDEFEQELVDHNVLVENTAILKQYFKKHFERYNRNRLQKRYIIKSSLFKYLYDCNNESFYNQFINQVG